MKQVFPWMVGSSIDQKNLRSRRKGSTKLASAVRACVQELEKRQMLSASPTADPGGPYTLDEGSFVVINGSGSSDSDGSIVEYKWDTNYDPDTGFTTDETGGAFTFNSADGPETRMLALRVTDNDGDQDTQFTTITVNDVKP